MERRFNFNNNVRSVRRKVRAIMENQNNIKMYLNTLNNVNGTIKLAAKKYDIDFIVELLSKLKEATHQLETLLIMEKEDRFTA